MTQDERNKIIAKVKAGLPLTDKERALYILFIEKSGK